PLSPPQGPVGGGPAILFVFVPNSFGGTPRHDKNPPYLPSSVNVKCGDRSADLLIGTVVANEHLTARHTRGPRDTGDVRVNYLRFPDLSAPAGVNSNQTSVPRSDIHPSRPDRDAAIDPGARGIVDAGVETDVR